MLTCSHIKRFILWGGITYEKYIQKVNLDWFMIYNNSMWFPLYRSYGCGRLDSNQRSSPYEGDEIGLFSTPRGCGGRTRTCDLQFMRLTSYQLLHPAIYGGLFFRSEPPRPLMKGNEPYETVGKADNYITRSCFEPLLRGTSSLAIRHRYH